MMVLVVLMLYHTYALREHGTDAEAAWPANRSTHGPAERATGELTGRAGSIR